MYNLYTHIATTGLCKPLTCKESLFTIFKCGLQRKYEEVWNQNNFVVYVMEGRKIWHTPNGSYDLSEGSCVFVRKGAYIVEQFFDSQFCFFIFFMPDTFICEVLKSESALIHKSGKEYDPVIPIVNSTTICAYFQSMLFYFADSREPDQSLLELKFKELILTISDNPVNSELLSYFYCLLQETQSVLLQRAMEDNFCFNLKLEDFARLSARSLSAFKRDFERFYDTSPGKWLTEKRLNHALHLLTNMGKTVSEATFESGFENASHFSRAFRQRFSVAPAFVKQQVIV